MEVAEMSLDDFERHVGETFVFSVESVERTVEGELIAAKTIKSDTTAERTPFCLDFKFAPDSNLGQSVYFAENQNFEDKIPMFLIPYAGDKDGWMMTAQFN